MKHLYLAVLIVLIFSCKEKKSQVASNGNTTLTNFVFDYSDMFSKNERDSLNMKIQQFELQTTNEIAIVTKDSIPNEITSYSVSLANQMGMGKEDKDNGLLILLIKYQRKVRISTGYGTEKILTDSICQSIIDNRMIPEFKQGNFYKGVDKGLDEIFIKWKDE